MCQLLPIWDAWLGPVLAAVLGMLALAAALELLCRRAHRRLAHDDSTHWTERARRAIELKQAAFATAAIFAVATAIEVQGWESASGCAHGGVVAIATVFVASSLLFRTLGAIDAAYRGASRTLAERVRSLLAFLLVVRPALLVTLLAACAGGVAPHDGRVWLWVLLVAVALYVASTGTTHGFARLLGLVQPARAEVARAVEQARLVSPTAVRSVDELAWLMPNAFAFPLTGRLAFTKTAANELGSEDLFGIALHELGHLRERRLVRWFRPAQSLVLLPIAVGAPLLSGGQKLGFGWLCGLALVLLIATIKLSRHHEAEADAHASAHAANFARSLEAIHRLAGIPAVLSSQTTHPNLYDRMLAAGVTPSYPRPKPPRRWAPVAVLLVTPLLIIGSELGVLFARHAVVGLFPEEQAAYVLVALNGKARDLEVLAGRVNQAQPELAARLMGRARELRRERRRRATGS